MRSRRRERLSVPPAQTCLPRRLLARRDLLPTAPTSSRILGRTPPPSPRTKPHTRPPQSCRCCPRATVDVGTAVTSELPLLSRATVDVGESPPPQATAIIMVSTATEPTNTSRNIRLLHRFSANTSLQRYTHPIQESTDSWYGSGVWAGSWPVQSVSIFGVVRPAGGSCFQSISW